jgi:CheY-like chemotaxis protein
VVVNLNLTLPSVPWRSQRLGLEVVRWLRAIPGHRFPVVGYSLEPLESIRKDRRFGMLFSADAAPLDLFWDPGNDCVMPSPVADDSKAQRLSEQALEAILRESDAVYRHGFARDVMAAVRLMRGAVRSGVVPPERGRKVLEQLAAATGGARGDFDAELMEWYIRAKAASATGSGTRPALPQSVLLLDDMAEKSGWRVVLKEIIGEGFRCAQTWDEARGMLKEEDLDAVLVDLDLGRGQGTGLTRIAELRRDHFALPLIAFSSFDRADTALRALRAGADHYFAKELGDQGDRESEDYFLRFASLLRSVPKHDDPGRKLWREFQGMEAKLDAWEAKQATDRYGVIGSGAFFRLAWFFLTENRPVEGQRTQDMRLTELFPDPRMAGQPALYFAASILTRRGLGLPDVSGDLSGLIDKLAKGLRVPNDESKELKHLNDLRGSKHALRFLAERRSYVSLYLHLTGQIQRNRPDWFTAGKERPPVQPCPLPADDPSKSHDERGRKSLEALLRGWEALGKEPYTLPKCRYLLVDDHCAEWLDLLRKTTQGGDFLGIDAAKPEAKKLTLHHIDAGGLPPVLLLDLDWGCGRGYHRAFELMEEVKKRRFDTPVLVMSAANDAVSLQRALRRGANQYFVRRSFADGAEKTYFRAFGRALEGAGRLAANYQSRLIWKRILGVEEVWASRESSTAEAASAVLRLAFFCYYPDRNPAERWRVERLADLEVLRQFFYFLVSRPVEYIRDHCKIENDPGIDEIMRVRNAAIYRKGALPDARGHFLFVLDEIGRLLGHGA